MTSCLRDTDTVLVEKPPLVGRADAVAPPGEGNWLFGPGAWGGG
jgi:hypothetical protein